MSDQEETSRRETAAQLQSGQDAGPGSHFRPLFRRALRAAGGVFLELAERIHEQRRRSLVRSIELPRRACRGGFFNAHREN